MKKILYIANIRLPTEKAHGVQIMEMCHAFAQDGNAVELIVPRRKNHIVEETFSFYDLPKNFRITRLFTWDLIAYGPIGFIIQSLTFALAALFYLRDQDSLVYSRDDLFLFLLSFTKKRYVYEVHAPKWHVVSRRAMKRASLVVLISHGLKDFYVQKGIPEKRLLVAPDGVNLERFSLVMSKEDCRTKLGLPQDKKIALYSGHLYSRKGAHVFAEAARQLGDDICCVFVGGTPVDIAEFKKLYGDVQNIRILGHRPHQDIPYYLSAADVLVLPNSAKDEDSRLYTSPMKLFEYMASGTPIIASDVPSLREVLTEENSLLVTPDEFPALAAGIITVFDDLKLATQLAENARHDVIRYSWNKREEIILNALNESA